MSESIAVDPLTGLVSNGVVGATMEVSKRVQMEMVKIMRWAYTEWTYFGRKHDMARKYGLCGLSGWEDSRRLSC